jgi:hypothetical protein
VFVEEFSPFSALIEKASKVNHFLNIKGVNEANFSRSSIFEVIRFPSPFVFSARKL